jgi:hypothetical protein
MKVWGLCKEVVVEQLLFAWGESLHGRKQYIMGRVAYMWGEVRVGY